MSVDIIEYKEEEDDDGTLRSCGIAYPVTDCGGEGLPLSAAGGAPCMAPLAWGGKDDPDYGKVQGWVDVTDLDGAGGTVLQGSLQAAYWHGKLWLRVGGGDEGEDANGDEEGNGADAAMDGSGCLGSCGEEGLPLDAPLRPVYPPVYICPMEARDAYLKAGGNWRGDVTWEVLANYAYHPEEGVINKDGSWVNDMRVTIWLVAVGNVLCFYTTQGARFKDDGSMAPTAARLRYSAFGRAYARADGSCDWEADGGPLCPFWCAPLPWEGREPDGTWQTESTEGICEAPGPFGTARLVAECGGDGLPTGRPAAPAPELYICPRLHSSELFGLAITYNLWPWQEGAMDGPDNDNPPTVKEACGHDSWLAACEALLLAGNIGADRPAYDFGDYTPVLYEGANNYRFDPWVAEAGGMYSRSAGYYSVGGEVATPFIILASTTLEGPCYPLHLAIAGASTDSTWLTASMFAEETTPDKIKDEDAGELPGSGTNPGGMGPGGEVIIPDDDDDDTPSGGYYYQAGSGVTITAKRRIRRTDVTYSFTVACTGAYSYSGTLAYEVEVELSTSNGGSYAYKGQDVEMYYGFSSETASSSVGVTFKSSYMYGDDDPKSCTCTLSMSKRATMRVSFPGQAVLSSDDPVPSSGLFTITATGKSVSVQLANGKRAKFPIYSIALDTAALRQLAAAQAAKEAPDMAYVSPDSIQGDATNIGAPEVSASVGDTTLKTQASGGGGSSALIAPVIDVSYTEARATIGVSGSSSWHYDEGEDEEGNPIQTAASGSISGSFTVTI